MPELIEVLLWVLVANFYCRGVIFDAVYYNPEYLKPRESYVPKAELDLQHFQVLWLAWGKTIEVIIKTRDNKQKSIYISLSTHGQIVRLPRELAVAMPEIPLAFIAGDTAICVWHRHHHFIRVKNVMKDRGPSILLDFKGFKKNLTEFYSEPQAKTTPIASLLLNQKYFNGIGNYLRAEILHAADIKPFDSAYKVLGDKQTFHRLTTETREVVRRILQLVGFHYNPYDINLGEYFVEHIIKVYGKGKSVEYPTNRTLWYLGELDGELITQLPEQNPKRSPRPEQVGPFLGWDASVMESFGDGIQFDEYTMKIVRVALSKVGRPPKVLRNGVKTKLGKNIKRRNRNGTPEYEKVPINFPE